MVSIISNSKGGLSEALASESVVLKKGSAELRGYRRLVVQADCDIEGKFDAVIMRGPIRPELKQCLRSDTVLFVSSADYSALDSLTCLDCVVVTVGFSERDAVCLTSVDGRSCSASVQREIPLAGGCVEVQEIVFDTADDCDLFEEVCARLTLLV